SRNASSCATTGALVLLDKLDQASLAEALDPPCNARWARAVATIVGNAVGRRELSEGDAGLSSLGRGCRRSGERSVLHIHLDLQKVGLLNVCWMPRNGVISCSWLPDQGSNLGPAD